MQNLAQMDGAVATQSTTCYRGAASRAIDGNTNGNWRSGSVQHTCNGANSWWMVTLDQIYAHTIHKVLLYSRSDCCSNRLADTQLQILDENGEVVASQPISGTELVYTFEFNGVVGRSVRVYKTVYGSLNIAEVEVRGTSTMYPTSSPTTSKPTVYVPNLALAEGAIATQSTTCHGGVASRAIDGNTDGLWQNGSVQHTCNEDNPWWMVTLDQSHAIDKVIAYGRSGYCTRIADSQLEILDDYGAVISSQAISGCAASYTFEFNGLVGRSVRISKSVYGALNIAEVEILEMLS